MGLVLELLNSYGIKELIHDVAGLYRLNHDQLLTLDKFGEKSTSNLLTSIDNSRNNSVERLLFGLEFKSCRCKGCSNYYGTFR